MSVLKYSVLINVEHVCGGSMRNDSELRQFVKNGEETTQKARIIHILCTSRAESLSKWKFCQSGKNRKDFHEKEGERLCCVAMSKRCDVTTWEIGRLADDPQYELCQRQAIWSPRDSREHRPPARRAFRLKMNARWTVTAVSLLWFRVELRSDNIAVVISS